MKKIGFVGVGVMGRGMVRNLRAAGFEVTLYTRTKAKIQDLLEEGFAWADSPAAAAASAEAVITMVGFPRDVEDVYFGKEGILDAMAPGGYVIDMTTTSPKLSVRIAAAAAEKGLHALDAPVSGGDTGARNGTLAIMVGGSQADFDACMPLFKAMGQNIRLTGGPGAGQHTKMANQICVAANVAGVAEAIAYGRANGLNVQNMLDAIATGAAGSWQLSNNGPKMIGGDYAPGFFIKHFVKDLNIVQQGAGDVQLTLPVTSDVLAMYKALAERGLEDEGTQALIEYFR